jgi:putative SOS response-associated peptidase YedK
MCNLYAVNTTQEELARLAEALDIDLGNFSGMASVFPDYPAPVLRLGANGSRRLEMMRWGFPPVGQNPSYVTNVRNLSSSYWKGWLKPEWRDRDTRREAMSGIAAQGRPGRPEVRRRGGSG